MSHIILLIVCILSVEIFIRINFLSHINSLLNLIKKITHIIPQKIISDHWKEKAIPIYALKLMKHSLKILFILLLILSLFLVADFFVNELLAFTLSFVGILESIVFAFGYAFIRKSFVK